MSLNMKRLVVKRLEEAGSLQYTRKTLENLHGELKERLAEAEEKASVKNYILRLMLHRLKL